MRKFVLFLVFGATLTLSAMGGGKVLDYGAISSSDLRAKGVVMPRSMADGEHFTALSDDKYAIIKYRYSDGVAIDTIFNSRKVAPSFAITSYSFSSDEKLLLLPSQVESIYRHSKRAYNWVYNIISGSMTPLSAGGKQQAAQFSPSGNLVAFVRDNNLFVVDIITKSETQLTIDGKAGDIINGVCDWVYEEEFGFERAFEWSPNSGSIAYYRFDESKVPTYYMPVFEGGLYPKNMAFKYPKAGENNSVVQIRVVQLSNNNHSSIDIGADERQYIPHIEWSGRGDELAIHRLNRLQNRYDLLLCNTVTGFSFPIYAEQSNRYVERVDAEKITFLPQSGRMVVKSEVNGNMQLYLYDMAGKFQHAITKGANEVTSIDGVNERGGRIFFTATDGALRRVLYSAPLFKSGSATRLASCTEDGYYSAHFSNKGKYYIQNFSSATTPNVYSVYQANGKFLRMLEDNSELSAALSLYDLPTKEFFNFTTEDGVTLNGYMLKPSDFDNSKQYPIFMTQYGGPGSQQVVDKWGIGWEAALVADGYLVVCVDGRGTGFRGFDFKSCTYGRLGELETIDQIAAARYLTTLPYVDAARIGIYGWSYGGFMALNCILKGADIFSFAIAVAPVTSWRYYDTIYTELYNGLPSDNAAGYDDNSPINYPDKLRGKLLIIHGTADDNVHIQNTYEMASALNRAGKQYDMIIYPDRNHGMGSNSGSDYNRAINEMISWLAAINN